MPPTTRPPLIGRQREIAALTSALDGAAKGRGSVHILAGESGIGKTRLTEAVLDRAVEKGFLTIIGRSFPVESGVYAGRVPGYQVLDLYAGWRLPWAPAIELSLDVQNLLDDRHSEYVGAPEIGRLVVGRLRAKL